METKKLILSLYVVASILIWFIIRSAIQYCYLAFYQIRRLAGITTFREVIPVILAVVTFVILMRHSQANLFMNEAVTELKKVTWPTRSDVTKSTTVVIICILISGLILAGFDIIWGKLISLLLHV